MLFSITPSQGKGRKDRQIPLVEEEVKALRNYLRFRATELILDDDTLFLAKNGTSLNVSSVKAIVAKYVKKAGIRTLLGIIGFGAGADHDGGGAF